MRIAIKLYVENVRLVADEDQLPILDRLDVDAERWTTVMATSGRMFGSAIVGAASRAAEAVRRRARWIVGALDVYQTT